MPFPPAALRFPGCPWVILPLVLGMVFWGWWLAALALPWGLTLSLGLVLVYLLGVGTGGIIPASVYLSMGVAAAVMADYFPDFWPTNLHYKYWAFTLISLWAAGLGYVYLMAKQGSDLQQRPIRDRQWGRVITLGSLILAMQGGGWLYRVGWPLGLG